uniref:Uncharacterized protein n=1 Tax=Arundo donax TaxID=35708 RepID=A0A0A8ZC17_ARUDO
MVCISLMELIRSLKPPRNSSMRRAGRAVARQMVRSAYLMQPERNMSIMVARSRRSGQGDLVTS